jgi:hypothetical protein
VIDGGAMQPTATSDAVVALCGCLSALRTRHSLLRHQGFTLRVGVRGAWRRWRVSEAISFIASSRTWP